MEARPNQNSAHTIADDGTRLEWPGSTLKYQRYRGRRANTPSSSAPIRRLKATSSHGEMACMGRTSRSRRPCARGEVLCTEPGKMGQKRKCPGLRGTPVLPSGADIVSLRQHVRLVPTTEVGRARQSCLCSLFRRSIQTRYDRRDCSE